MLLDDGVRLELIRGALQVLLGEIELVGLEVRPAQAVEVRAVVRLDLQRLLQIAHRLVEALTALREHVAEVVERGGIVGVSREHLAERRLGVDVLLLFVEDGTELERNPVVLGKLRLRVAQHVHRLRAAVGVRVHLREPDVGERLVRVRLHRLLEERDPLIRFAVVAQRPRFEQQDPQVVRVPDERCLRDVDGGAVLLRGDIRLDQVAGDGGIVG